MDIIGKILMSLTISSFFMIISLLSLHPLSPLVWILEKYNVDYDDILDYGTIVYCFVSVIIGITVFMLL